MNEQVRLAEIRDVHLLVRHRRLMFIEMNNARGTPVDMPALDTMCLGYGEFLKNHLGKDVLGIIVEFEKAPISSGTASIMGVWPPKMTIPQEHSSGYIYGIYTELEHRRKGFARIVMRSLIARLKDAGVKIVSLYASDAGKPVYEGLGFKQKPSWMILENPE